MKKFLVLLVLGLIALAVPAVYDLTHGFNIHQWQYWAIYDLEYPISALRQLTGIDG